MSELVVGSIAGLAANSYVVDVSAGSTLDLTNATSLPSSALPTGSVLQVVSTTKTDTFSTSLTPGTFASITGLSATITPRSTSSKILVIYSVHGARASYPIFGVRVTRDGTAIGVGDSAGNRTPVGASLVAVATDQGSITSVSNQYLDAPSSTSALTYQVQGYTQASGTEVLYVNRTTTDSDVVQVSRPTSSITLMEIAG